MRSKSAQHLTIALLGLAFVSLIATFSLAGAASTDAAITATPDGSNIFRVIGTGFDADDNVTLTLVANGTTYYNFTEALTSDTEGNFTAVVIVPTYITGATYNLTASTSNVTAYTEYNVPDLTGPTGSTGPTGATGAAGENGVAGADGKNADQTLTIGAIGIGLISLAIGVYAVIKKP